MISTMSTVLRASDSDLMGTNCLSSSSSSDGTSNGQPTLECVIYIVCGCYGHKRDVSCEIYAIDIANSGGGRFRNQAEESIKLPVLKPMPKPVRAFTEEEIPSFMGYFMVGDYIYMIGGRKGVQLNSGRTPNWVDLNYVFTYNVKTSELCQHPPMNYSKRYPVIIGPIKVAEKNLCYYTMGQRLNLHNFEAFIVNPDEPSCGRWIALQQPCVPHSSSSYEDTAYTILGHVILDENYIILSTQSAGVFCYDIQRNFWTQLNPFAKLPFQYGAQFVRDLYYGFSPTPRDPSRIIVRGDDLLVHRSPSSKTVRGLHPLSPISGTPIVCLTPLTDDVLCLVRSVDDGNRFSEVKPHKKLLAFNVFRPQITEFGDTINTVDYFSDTYILDEAFGLTHVCACLPSKQAAINFPKILSSSSLPLETDVLVGAQFNDTFPSDEPDLHK